MTYSSDALAPGPSRWRRASALLRAHEFVGVDLVGQGGDPGVEPHLVARLLGREGGLATSHVAVEEQRHVHGVASQQARLLQGEGRAQRADDVVDAARVERHDVEVALDEDGLLLLADGVARLPEAEEVRSLHVDRASRAS